MKKSYIKSSLVALLFLGSFGSFFYLNSPAVRQNIQNPLKKGLPQADSDKEHGDLVLPDVTVIQKAIDLIEKLMYK